MRNMKQPRTMPCIITRKILGWHSVQMIEPGGHVMNFRQAQTTTAQGTSLRSATGMRLSGYWLVLARVVWIAVVVLILALFVEAFRHSLLFSRMLVRLLLVMRSFPLIA